MPAKNNSLSFDKLKLESIVVEWRYPFAYLFWDRAGQVFETIRRRLPAGNINLGDAKPGVVAIIYEGRFEITVETTRFWVACGAYLDDMKQFLEIASTVYKTVIEVLNIENFERVGLRQVFSKKYPSLRKANEALSQLPSIAMLQKPLEHHRNMQISPSALIRIEDEAKGYTFTIKAGERDFSVGIPAVYWDGVSELERNISHHHSLLLLDIDAYTKSEVSVDQFEVAEWVRQQRESVKSDAAMFF